MKDLHALPKVRDSLTYLYVEHCRVEQEAKSITLFDQRGSVAVPCSALNLLMLGQGHRSPTRRCERSRRTAAW